MASRFSQIAGEVRAYEQDIVGDPGDEVVSVLWEVEPRGPTFSGAQHTSTLASVLFSSSLPGSFLVTATIDLSSGQKVKGQARIDVVKDSG